MKTFYRLTAAALISSFAFAASAQTEQADDGIQTPKRMNPQLHEDSDIKPRYHSFQEYDRDGDSYISREESADDELMTRWWTDLDLNADDQMDEDEFSQFEEAWQKAQGTETPEGENTEGGFKTKQ